MKEPFFDPEKKQELYKLHYSQQELPFHKGEMAAQQLAGEELIAFSNGKIISPKVSPAVAPFITSLPFAIACTQDKEHQLWVSVLTYEKGGLSIPDEETLLLYQEKLLSNPLNNFDTHLASHPYMGLLFIDSATRRRYRVNGLASLAGNIIKIAVEQAFVNCPKYIQKRETSVQDTTPYSSHKQQGSQLTEELKKWISSSDTFFVGSSNHEGKLDASHRGGKAGFIKVKDAKTLRIPDYIGNSMYNTLGNFMVNPGAALLFIDFKNHQTLQLTGTADVEWDKQRKEPESGILRYWNFHITSWVVMENVNNLRSDFINYSPFNPS